MKKSVLTDEFIATIKPIGLAFPKPVKVDKGFMRHGIPVRNKTKLARKVAYKRKFHIPKEKSRGQWIKELDGMISNYILVKICRGICMRCGKQHTQYENKKGEMKWSNYGCSHYWPRDFMGTRFEADNLDGLCWLPCHGQKWEKAKQGDYKDYMMKKLGKKGYEKLEIKARGTTKFSTIDIKLMIANFSKIWK